MTPPTRPASRASAVAAAALLALTAIGCPGRRPAAATTSTHITKAISGSVLDIRGPTEAWAPDPTAPQLLQVGRWIAVKDQIAYTYVDHEAGLSARVASDPARAVIIRLSHMPAAARYLDPAEVAERGLPEVPAFVANYGEQPEPGTWFGSWRTAPGLAHRWHPEYPDDLLVALPTQQTPTVQVELIWARVFDCEGLTCKASLINQPHHGRLRMGDLITFDATDVPADQPPLAQSPREPVPQELARELRADPNMRGLVVDPRAWEPDLSVPAAQRMPPIGQWFVVGDELSFGVLTKDGPGALRFREGGVLVQTISWLPRGAVLLTDDQVARANLPASIPLESLPPQPAPGTWGTWRTREDLSWLFAMSGDPDIVTAIVDPSLGPVQLRVRSCGPTTCEATLEAAVGKTPRGTPYEFGVMSVGSLRARGAKIDIEERLWEFPVAWPKGESPPGIPEILGLP